MNLLFGILFKIVFFDNTIDSNEFFMLREQDAASCCEVCGRVCDWNGTPLQKNVDTCILL
jgi:hypothetical protein